MLNRNWTITLLAIGLTTVSACGQSAPPDGQVNGLNQSSFEAFQAIKQRNPGALTEQDAQALKQALLADQRLDDQEQDLLVELTQSQFRSITITPSGGQGQKIRSYPVSGATKTVLSDTLNPPVDYSACWERGREGYLQMLTDAARSEKHEANVTRFLEEKFREKWRQSNMANGYKPLRDQLGVLNAYTSQLPQPGLGKKILSDAMGSLDRSESDSFTHFLRNGLRP